MYQLQLLNKSNGSFYGKEINWTSVLESAENKSAFFIIDFTAGLEITFCAFQMMEKWNQLLFALCRQHIYCVPFKRIMECWEVRILKKENSRKWQNVKMKIKQALLFHIYT